MRRSKSDGVDVLARNVHDAKICCTVEDDSLLNIFNLFPSPLQSCVKWKGMEMIGEFCISSRNTIKVLSVL